MFLRRFPLPCQVSPPVRQPIIIHDGAGGKKMFMLRLEGNVGEAMVTDDVGGIRNI